MSIQKLNDTSNSGYVSSEETDSLLVSSSNPSKGGGRTALLRQVKSSSTNGPTTGASTSSSGSVTGSGSGGGSATGSNSAAGAGASKPQLMRQDRTSTYLTSPQQSQHVRMGSEESMRGGSGAAGHDEDVEQGLVRSSIVPDIEVHEEDQEHGSGKGSGTMTTTTNNQQQQPTISIMNLSLKPGDSHSHSSSPGSHPNLGTSSYQNLASSIPPSVPSRCRACRNCSRRASTTPTTLIDRSASRDSVKSAFQQGNLSGSMAICISNSALPQQQQQQQQYHLQQQQHYQLQQQHLQHLQQQQQQQVPPVLITSSPTNGSRIIRQSSQPESSSTAICCGPHSACVGHAHSHSHTVPNVSLKQLRESSGDGIAGIAADSLRINGGMRPFKQVRIQRLIKNEKRPSPEHPTSLFRF